MNYRDFFKKLVVSDHNISRMLKDYLSWADKKFGVEYTLREQQRIAVKIIGTVKIMLFIRKTSNYIYVQFIKFPDSFVKFVKSKLSEPESVELIHEGGTVCRFRVSNDSDLDVLKKLTTKYSD